MRRLIAAVFVALLATGCAALPATNEELREPWRPQPLPVDRETISASEQACRAAESDFGVQGPATTGRLVAVDARGGGRLTLLYVGRGDAYLACQVDVGPEQPRWIGGSSADAGAQHVLAADDVVIVGSGGMSGGGGASSSVVGRVGVDVTAVRVVFASGSSLQASVGDGWFLAWWPTAEMGFVAEALNASGQKVSEARH